MNKQSKKEKFTTTKYSIAAIIIIIAVSFLPYLHDFELVKSIKPSFGFRSGRTMFYIISLFIFGISGWVFAFIRSKGKIYRFAIIAPVIMGLYQLLIYITNSREDSINEFDFKVLVNFIVFVSVIIYYIYLKKKQAR